MPDQSMFFFSIAFSFFQRSDTAEEVALLPYADLRDLVRERLDGIDGIVRQSGDRRADDVFSLFGEPGVTAEFEAPEKVFGVTEERSTDHCGSPFQALIALMVSLV